MLFAIYKIFLQFDTGLLVSSLNIHLYVCKFISIRFKSRSSFLSSKTSYFKSEDENLNQDAPSWLMYSLYPVDVFACCRYLCGRNFPDAALHFVFLCEVLIYFYIVPKDSTEAKSSYSQIMLRNRLALVLCSSHCPSVAGLCVLTSMVFLELVRMDCL